MWMRMFRHRQAPSWIAFEAALLLTAVTAAFAGDVDFDADVRPILSENCFQCHGPDEATREADLRLDTSDGAFADLGGYAAFVRNDPSASEALTRIDTDDPGAVMPPPASKLTLTAREKEILRKWVENGAEWSEHWSFVRPQIPLVPTEGDGWAINEIDRFVYHRAKIAGLNPEPQASREALIRRVTLDLTGLPPTLEEIDEFLGDESEDAYEKVVDRLLASPHYGERMAWEWLDAARYADTDGFQGDPTRTMWPWRDWLVNALNENRPFDQFTIEMLAGDLLPNATAEQILATGFNRNHMFNGEGGRIAEETRVENVFDRTETTGTVWLGLTMTCCRCHDHKYDALTLDDYFRFYAFFDNTSETGRSGRGKTAPVLDYLPPGERQRRAGLEANVRRLDAQLTAPHEELDAGQAEWETSIGEQLADSGGGTKLGSWWQLGPIKAPGGEAYRDDFGPEKKVDLKATVSKQQWKAVPSVTDGKVFALPETVGATYFYREIESPSAREVSLSFGSDDNIKVFLNGKQIVANQAARAAAADQELVTAELVAGTNDLLVKIVNTGGIGGFYFQKKAESILGLPAEVVSILRTDAEKRNEAQRKQLQQFYRSKNWPEWKTLNEQRVTVQKQLDQLAKQATTVMVMDDLPEGQRRTTYMLERGGYDKPTDVSVTAGTPKALPLLPGDGRKSRLDLANWLVDPANPLTARVTVNRYWQTFFDRGIVESTEDFGVQGTRPTHPALLDWLALRFIESGWNVKELHKLIVMSATYRQGSRVTERALETDPKNTWFARAPRYRMPSWMLRDQALAASGLLNREMGGPSIKPYQPEGIWADATFGKIKYQPDSGAKLYRRSLYIFWRRIVGPTMFFDSAKRQTCEVKPSRTNTPLHALTTMNETAFLEAARAMAQRVMAEADSPEQRIERAFRLVTSRKPTSDEALVLLNRLEALTEDFKANVADAEALLAVGVSERDASLDPAEHASYTMICSIVLNLDETLSKQ